MRVQLSEVVTTTVPAGGNPTPLLVVPGALAQVNVHGGGAASVYAAETGATLFSGGNPQTVGTYGRVDGWVDVGRYDIVVTYSGGSYTQPFDALASDAPTDSILVESYGAVGDGVADDAAAIRAADVVAAATGADLIFSGNYLIKSPIPASDGAYWQGRPGSSILIDSTFVAGDGVPASSAAIYNEHWADSYNGATADSVEFHDLAFISTATTTAPTRMLFFANTKKLVVDNCYVSNEGSLAGNPIELYAGCKHAWITNNIVTNLTGTVAGVCLYIKNQCVTNGATTETSDIHVTGNYVASNCGDETFCIQAQDGPIRDVEVIGNTFEHLSGGSTTVNFVGMYGSVTTPTAYSLLENVVFVNNTLRIDNFTVFGLGVGTGDTAPLRNILLSGNTITCAVSATGTTRAIGYYTTGTNANVVAKDNLIINSGATNISVGVWLMPVVDGNVLKGKFSLGVQEATVANNNRLEMGNVGDAFSDCATVTNNTVDQCGGSGVNCPSTANYDIRNNRIKLGAAGFAGVYGSAGNPVIYAIGNIIETVAGPQWGFYILGTGVPKLGTNAWVNGGGTFMGLTIANAWVHADNNNG